MLVKLTKAYEEVAKKSHRMRLDALEAFTWHSIWVFYVPTVIQRPGQLMGNGPSTGRRPP